MLLVPNKHLETPNYRLERLRHDDPRLENLQASYTMIDEPDDEVGITRREKTKAKQEPVIKGILPETPAPVAPPEARADAGAAAPRRSPRTGRGAGRAAASSPGSRGCSAATEAAPRAGTGGGAGAEREGRRAARRAR